MLLTVQELRDRVESDLSSLIEDLTELTGRSGDNERSAWERSLPAVARALTHPSLAQVHVHFERRMHTVALEYELPGTQSRCDVIVLGRHKERPSAVIIELKDWETGTDRPRRAEGLIERRGEQALHPSDQVRGYVEYCRNFHSAVVEHEAGVHGFVLFTAGFMTYPYTIAPNEDLAANYPIFTTSREDLDQKIPTGKLAGRARSRRRA